MKRAGTPKRTRIRPRSKRWSLTQELDALLRKVVLARDGHRCRKCGREDRTLNASHIWPKGAYPHLRWHSDNVVTLCAMPCHLSWWHKNPIEAMTWIAEILGDETFTRLRLMAKSRGKVDKKLTRLYLEQELERYAA